MEPVAVWKRAPVAFAIVLLLVGGAAGFGVGYSVGNSGGKSTAKVAKAPGGAAKQKKAQVPKQTQAQKATLDRLVACMAQRGVKYPQTPGGPHINKPPPGVAQTTYKTALEACYVANAKTPNG